MLVADRIYPKFQWRNVQLPGEDSGQSLGAGRLWLFAES